MSRFGRWFCWLVAVLPGCLSSSPPSEEVCNMRRAEKAGAEAVSRGDLRAAYEVSLPCAREGLAEAQFALGLLVDADVDGEALGMSSSERDAEMLKWVAAAARQDHPEAADVLGHSYRHGLRGLTQDPARAECWERVAESAGAARDCPVDNAIPDTGSTNVSE